MLQPIVRLLGLLGLQRMTMQRRHLQLAGAYQLQRQLGVAPNRMLDEGIAGHGIAPFMRALEGHIAQAVQMDMAQHLGQVAFVSTARRTQQDDFAVAPDEGQRRRQRAWIAGGFDQGRHASAAGYRGCVLLQRRRIQHQGMSDAASARQLDAPSAEVQPDDAPALQARQLRGEVAHQAQPGHRDIIAQLDDRYAQRREGHADHTREDRLRQVHAGRYFDAEPARVGCVDALILSVIAHAVDDVAQGKVRDLAA